MLRGTRIATSPARSVLPPAVAVLAVLLALVFAEGCGGGGSSPVESTDAGAICYEADYVLVGVSRGACRAIVGSLAHTTTDYTRAPAWVTPVAGATLPRGGLPPPFTWMPFTVTPGDKPAYMVVFRDGSGREVLRVFTNALTWTADRGSWSKLSAVPLVGPDAAAPPDAGPALPQLSATLVGVDLSGTHVRGDPVTGQPRTFYVGP